MKSWRVLLLVLLAVLLPVRAVVAQGGLLCAIAGHHGAAVPELLADVAGEPDAAADLALSMPCHESMAPAETGGHAGMAQHGHHAMAAAEGASSPCHEGAAAGDHGADGSCSLCGSCCTAVAAVSVAVLRPALPVLGSSAFPVSEPARPGPPVIAPERPPRLA